MTATETLLELEDQLWRANREGDGSFYAHWLREDALAVSKYGIIDKAAAVPGIQANHSPYLRTPRTDEKVIIVDENTAVITYRVEVTVLLDGQEAQFPSYASTVWNNTSGDWRVVFHQQTAL
ncbi:nuclear transport factor 2 family protein [Kribbella antibiotica]|uniref:Nuclear transport factor 2 family protein n=1 Tax=Kribbella antibiotica TaxID=190195 RepID=A0A4R4YXR7_9ACTN|nr:nuclear transport factor 2 family protein [Kribbella antibiotica]TDD48482.1 nuclear transport factor 2 family protein [Kribbella antibiotica]